MTKSIRMHTGDIHSASLPPLSFDVVTVLDTFYYFPQPRRELDAIRKILKPDGLLVLVLVSARSHLWRNTGWRTSLLGGPKGSLFDSHHVFFYDPPAIRATLSRSGFRIDSIRPLPAIDQGNSLRNGLARGYFAMSVAAWYLSRARLMLGPRFLVAASP
jgi:SAM-dependent methyltransferase